MRIRPFSSSDYPRKLPEAFYTHPLAHPRWQFVVQPKYAAYLNLLEAWWKILRSLALKGRRFETWAEISQAVSAATAYWNAYRHPFVWGRGRQRRRRARVARLPGVATLPKVA